MLPPRRLVLAGGALAGIHLVVALAGFFAPYHYAAQNREYPLAPPMRLHLADPEGNWSWPPFVYRMATDQGRSYREEQSRPLPVRLLARCEGHRILGVFSSRWHLLGVDRPGQIFLLGTDSYGRDYLSRLIYGGQISLLAGLMGTSVSLALAVVLGGLAGFYGRWVDDLIMRVADLFLGLPWLYLLLAARAFLPLNLGPGQTFLLTVGLLGVVGWARPARLVRGVVLSGKQLDFVSAALGFGASDFYLFWRHVLPQTLGLLLTQAAVLVPQYVLAEVTLSFVGLGVAEPLPSWGNMLATLQQYHILARAWWIFAPGLALSGVCWSYHSLATAAETRWQRARA